MTDIKLFKIEGKEVSELEYKPVSLEKEIQNLIEKNMEELLGIRFLASEHATGKQHAGRIDSLGLDENNQPVIIEYKRHTNQNVINQGLYYLDWLLDHKGDFEMLVLKNLGKRVEVDWTGYRILCVAEDFTKYDTHAVEQINRNLELIRFRRYGDDLLLFELVNVVEGEEPKNHAIKKDWPGIKVYHAKASDDLKELFEEIEHFILSLGDDIQKKELKFYYAYKKIKNFVCAEVRPQSEAIRLYLKLDPKSFKDLPTIARDVSNIGHYGTGDLELKVKNKEDAKVAFEYIIKAYDAS
jgi:predicted transport protein